ncbi:MAG TPA: hypothetical protein VNA30_07930, partial [Mycobacteriales bacterium]|nr:hypothetical protein [Mycobacteriales bacterium]
GVAYLGDASSATPPLAVVRALGKVAAYAAVTWRFDPAGSVVLTSRGSPRYASGRAVRLPRVFGHQDTSATACPGKLQSRLGDVRARAKALVGPAPRITETAVSGTPVHPPAPMSVTARLSREVPWTVAVTDPSGAVVAMTQGESTEPRLLWDGMLPLTSDGPALLPAPAGTYRWTVRVDDGWHLPAERSETFEVSLPLVPVAG